VIRPKFRDTRAHAHFFLPTVWAAGLTRILNRACCQDVGFGPRILDATHNAKCRLWSQILDRAHILFLLNIGLWSQILDHARLLLRVGFGPVIDHLRA
jgi:hypothetical protein